ncbi:MAG: hypothetical protein QF366_01765 [Candidatus Poseidoniia archaeon]|nr:hypothetical protein [Candidatus Poseidoniia archaeon]MDP7007176.1 hypothetical protein [Candidatus Poseidoniia archaeon]
MFRAFLVALTVVLSSLGTAALASGEEIFARDEFEVHVGTVAEHDEARDKLGEQGDFIAIQLGADTWFAVVYGTEEYPNAIHMRSWQMRYLGGATVVGPEGGVITPETPLPVVRASGQALPLLLEFQDSGYEASKSGMHRENVGGGNGLFDFQPKPGFHGVGILDGGLGQHEPVMKMVNLNTVWTPVFDPESDVSIDEENRTAQVSFALTARDLPYIYVDEDQPETPEVLEEVTITFRLTVSLVEKSIDVPWYRVTVSRDGVEASERDGERTFSGRAVESHLKYDHYLEGWDYRERSEDSRLMLLTFTFFATFVPNQVAQWMNQQFIDQHLTDGAGRAEFETDYEIDQQTGEERHFAPGQDDEAGEDGHPDKHGKMKYRAREAFENRVQRLRTNSIEFHDSWDRAGKLTWVSNVSATVGNSTTEQPLYHQLHAMEGLQSFMAKENPDKLQDIRADAHVSGMVLLGGYVYPAGDALLHDPTFEVSALLAEIGTGLQTLLAKLGLLQLAELAAVGVLAIALTIRGRRRTALLKE